MQQRLLQTCKMQCIYYKNIYLNIIKTILITYLTINYNNKAGLEKTMVSVNQDYTIQFKSIC